MGDGQGQGCGHSTLTAIPRVCGKAARTDLCGGRGAISVPTATVMGIRPRRDKLPPQTQRAVCSTTIFPPNRTGTCRAQRPCASVTVTAWSMLSGDPHPARRSRTAAPVPSPCGESRSCCEVGFQASRRREGLYRWIEICDDRHNPPRPCRPSASTSHGPCGTLAEPGNRSAGGVRMAAAH